MLSGVYAGIISSLLFLRLILSAASPVTVDHLASSFYLAFCVLLVLPVNGEPMLAQAMEVRNLFLQRALSLSLSLSC